MVLLPRSPVVVAGGPTSKRCGIGAATSFERPPTIMTGWMLCPAGFCCSSGERHDRRTGTSWISHQRGRSADSDD